MAAPPYLEDTLHDVLTDQPSDTLATHASSAVHTTSAPANVNTNLSTSLRASAHSSNNVLNPNLSGSFKDGDDDDAPLQCIYEPVAAAGTATIPSVATAAPSTSNSQRQRTELAVDANPDSVFIQTPTQGGIAVAALPSNNNNITNNNTNDNGNSTIMNRFW